MKCTLAIKNGLNFYLNIHRKMAHTKNCTKSHDLILSLWAHTHLSLAQQTGHCFDCSAKFSENKHVSYGSMNWYSSSIVNATIVSRWKNVIMTWDDEIWSWLLKLKAWSYQPVKSSYWNYRFFMNFQHCDTGTTGWKVLTPQKLFRLLFPSSVL